MSRGKQIAWLRNLSNYADMAKVMGEYNDDKDYVGPEGSWKTRIIPRKAYGVDINVAAYVHDYYYALGGSSEDRFKADAVFLADMMRQVELCLQRWYQMPRRHFARLRFLKYFEAVRRYGSGLFPEKEVGEGHGFSYIG